MFCRKALFLAGLTLCVSFECIGQVVTSAQNGYWHEPSTWIDGVVPSPTNCSQVRVAHAVRVTTSAAAPSLEITTSLIIESSGELDIVPPVGGGEVRVREQGLMQIDGILVGRDSVLYHAAPDRIQFRDGGWFHYRGASRGFIPHALWHPNSTFLINGFVGSGYIAIAYSESWKQEFGNVIYDCPLQTSFVDLNGYLKNIQGDLVVRNTNNQSLRLSTTQRPVIQIGGDLRVEGPSEVWFTTTSDSARIHVGGNFQYYSTSTGPSYFTTRGRCYVEVGGAFHLDATGPLRICSGSPDSTGIRMTSLVLRRGLTVNRGGFIAPFPGRGLIILSGNEVQDVNTIAGAFSGNMDFFVDSESVADLNQSEIVTQGRLRVRGHLRVGSLDPAGALQQGMTGNFQTVNTITFYPGSFLEYNGSAAQFVGSVSPSHSGVNVMINNPGGVTLLGDLVTGDLTVVSGTLDLNSSSAKVDGHVVAIQESSVINGDIVFTGKENVVLDIGHSVIRDLILEKSAGAEVNVIAPVSVRGRVSVRGEGVTLNSNGFITLASFSDEAGATAGVDPMPPGSSIEGDVTVQRFMSGEGRLYRYISSPVESASVAALQDDFPVTGSFSDPSLGTGIHPGSPSLYYYHAGWQPFPVSGYAAENILQPGRGYAAFVRGNASPVIMDLTGRLNQGSISLPVAYHEMEDPMHTGWSLVGNPYASAIDWNSNAGWTRSPNMGLVFAIRDNGEGRFRYSDGEVGDANGGLIAQGQAFWVHASSPHPEITVHEEAKANLDAAFYRTETDFDFIRIGVEGNGSRDEVHIRKKAGAMAEVDPADALKRWNDRLSLSVLSADSVPLAFSAVGNVSCVESYPLMISYPPEHKNLPTPLPSGSYTLTTDGFGLFQWSELLLVDGFSGDTVDARAYSFSVGNDPASGSTMRFTLLVRSHAPETPDFHQGEFACGDSVAVLQLSEPGKLRGQFLALVEEREYLFDAAGKAYIPFPELEQDLPAVSIVARNACQQYPIGEVSITRLPVPEAPRIYAPPRCGPGQVYFSIQDPVPDAEWYWYDDAEEEVCVYVSRSPGFLTPPLHKSKSFYVVVENGAGCRSAPVRAEAIVVPMDIVHLWEEDRVLYSSQPETEWYGDSGWLHTGMFFEPPASGVYTARVYFAECVSEKTIHFGEFGDIDFFPIPFLETLRAVSGQRILDLEVNDARGQVVLKANPMRFVYTIDTSDWPSGMYIAKVVLNNSTTLRKKIIKQ